MTHLEFNLQRLEEFSKLEQNWNGNISNKGATPFTKTLLAKVEKILNTLVYQPHVFPTASDSIQLEYENHNKYLEFEILEDSIFMMFNNNVTETEIHTKVEESEINGYVQKLFLSN